MKKIVEKKLHSQYLPDVTRIQRNQGNSQAMKGLGKGKMALWIGYKAFSIVPLTSACSTCQREKV
jgi:hypothetical protein